ncbi:MAG TPA: putative sulfate exporter family transporter [Candidatus Eisenbacteria bacterium]|nr:putative sulfate exporter family transporter [Candidatus Eisenbacteria bacterium]
MPAARTQAAPPSVGAAPAAGIAGILPGLALAVLVALAARLVHQSLPKSVGTILGEVLFAVVIGLVVGNAIRLPESMRPGLKFAFHAVLRTAIVLLGATFSFRQVLQIGGKAVLLVVVLMAIALTAAHLLGRAAGIPGRLATLIGVGTAVCGNSAIAATAPVIRARDDEVSFAIATNTVFGTLAVLLYPLIGKFTHMGDAAYGTWAGTAVNDTSQVVAAGFAYGDLAGRVATAVKLTRNALMGGVILAIGIAYARSGADVAAGSAWGRVKQSFPIFVVGFLVMALLNTLGFFVWLSAQVHVDVPRVLLEASRALILVALAAVGLSTRLESMRQTGLKPFLIGLGVAALTSGASLLLIRILGPASL